MKAFIGYLVRPEKEKPYFFIKQYEIQEKPIQKRKGKKK